MKGSICEALHGSLASPLPLSLRPRRSFRQSSLGAGGSSVSKGMALGSPRGSLMQGAPSAPASRQRRERTLSLSRLGWQWRMRSETSQRRAQSLKPRNDHGKRWPSKTVPTKEIAKQGQSQGQRKRSKDRAMQKHSRAKIQQSKDVAEQRHSRSKMLQINPLRTFGWSTFKTRCCFVDL